MCGEILLVIVGGVSGVWCVVIVGGVSGVWCVVIVGGVSGVWCVEGSHMAACQGNESTAGYLVWH